mgnify:FL=1|jgi:hypothetical protein
MSFEDYISGRQEAFKNASSEGRSELPIGKYQGIINEAVIKQSEKDGKYYVRFGILVEGPTHVGFKTSVLHCLSKPEPGKTDRIGYLKTDLKTLGVELEDITKIRDALEVVPDRRIDFEIWKKGEYINVSIKKLILEEGPVGTSVKPEQQNKAPF